MARRWFPELAVVALLGCAPGFDADGDGWAVGPDCDDGDAAVFPGAEDPFGDGADTDCDGADGVDADGDGYRPDAEALADCDDSDPAIHPESPEAPFDGVDANCDGYDRLFAEVVTEDEDFTDPPLAGDGTLAPPATWGEQPLVSLPPPATTLAVFGTIDQLSGGSWAGSDRDGLTITSDGDAEFGLLLELDWTMPGTDLDARLFCGFDQQTRIETTPGMIDSIQPEVGNTGAVLPAGVTCHVAVLGYLGQPTEYLLLITPYEP
jgi:hypothetical protein